MHTYVYLRVSTADQTTQNQLLEIRAAGYQPDSIYSEVCSGKVAAMDRLVFAKMVDAISHNQSPSRLVVSKLDRLGRDAVDVVTTVKSLSQSGTQVRVLQLGDLDLSSTAGKLVLTTLSAVAQMERDIIVERTLAGINRAREQGKHIGRPKAAGSKTICTVKKMLGDGVSISEIARQNEISRATVHRIRDGVYTS